MDTILIVVPCYNSAKYIAETIASIKAQTSDCWKCVIVDDGSTDKTLEIVNELISDDDRFSVIQQQHGGVAKARNYGISSFDCKYVLPLDSDDMLTPIAIETFLDTFKKNPDASLLVPMIKRFSNFSEPVIQKRQWKGYETLKMRCTNPNSSCFKRSDWERIGGYRSETMYEDWEFWIRLLYDNDNVINIPEVLIEYRVHPDSRWFKAVKRHGKEVQIIRKLNKNIYG